ncbi:MAG: hypothetical protein PWP49_1277 [Thermococcaceae archaeon]|jgi:hypothetical protein|uniref:hypothetical protein n=1 Tax=Thermococcus TaxID=2263 RepID=UPI0005B276D8|nr:MULTISPECIES: hypothetical protein [Thermococcus]KUJ98681.1 MAG: Uncharacterized protein XD43_1655 [Thermococcales archaeon 44_46]MDK2782552.1 hypothetical protein [Thermococcaceae archaeon]MCA6213359.1 hypothetical protein [Thermococcus bergensis]MDK2853595.1 hypothetical protein [Thermococcaceae archaeon]MDK2984227.1 hypothetical protein [Thermococcaceae archaeon]
MEKLKKAIEEFNRLHGSEAQAKIIEIRDDEAIIEFKGYFCKTCGLFDYFEDIKWEAMEFELKVEPVEVIEEEEDFEKGRYVVKYKIHAREASE